MLTLALTSGVVAALLALRYLRERTTPLMASEPRTASIVLSARNLPVGAMVTERDLKVVNWPATTVPSGYVRSVKDAVGRGIITPVGVEKLPGRGRPRMLFDLRQVRQAVPDTPPAEADG